MFQYGSSGLPTSPQTSDALRIVRPRLTVAPGTPSLLAGREGAASAMTPGSSEVWATGAAKLAA